MAAKRGSRDRFPGLRESCYLLAFSLAARERTADTHARKTLHPREGISQRMHPYTHVYTRADLHVKHVGRLCVGLTTGAGIIRNS